MKKRTAKCRTHMDCCNAFFAFEFDEIAATQNAFGINTFGAAAPIGTYIFFALPTEILDMV